MSGRLIGLHSYRINQDKNTVETSQLVSGCVSNLVYFNSKKLVFFTKDNGSVYKYVHSGGLSKLCSFYQSVSTVSLGNSLAKDPAEESLFVVTAKNRVAVYGDITEEGHSTYYEVLGIEGVVTHVVPGYRKGFFFVVTQSCQILSFQTI